MQQRALAGHGRLGAILQLARQLVLAAVLIAAFTAAAAGADGIVWHETFEDALLSAQTSHKPVVVFAFSGLSPAYQEMAAKAFASPEVISASERFECFALDVTRTDNKAVQERLRLAPVADEAGARHGVYPVTVFLDHAGKEHFRRHGYLTPAALTAHLDKAHRLIECTEAVTQQPNDARAHRELGRAYMEMDMEKGDPYYQAVSKHLERAIELDPDNGAGANFDARVDLAIFRIPDTPEQSFGGLSALQAEPAGRERRFEMQYYMAVAQCAMGNDKLVAAEGALGEGEELSDQQAVSILRPFHAAAADLLMPFYTEDRASPYYASEWTSEALALLYQLRPDLKQLRPGAPTP